VKEGSTPRRGAAYFGNRMPRHVARDMEELAGAGFTGVLHTLSENDLLFYRQTMAEIVRLSQRAGLEVQVNPWALGHVFGGEAESRFGLRHPEACQVLSDGRTTTAGCPNHPLFRAFVREWAGAAVETGADHVFLDEPHWINPALLDDRWPHVQVEDLADAPWACRCATCRRLYRERLGEAMPAVRSAEVQRFREDSMVDFLADLVAHVAGLGGRSTVCLLPLLEGPAGIADWDAVAALPGLGTIATDPYWRSFRQPTRPFVSEFARLVRAVGEAHGVSPQIWIQGFRLTAADIPDVAVAVEAARSAGVEDLWTWGWHACGHMSYLATPDSEAV
jgi:hypothetical protein